LRPEGQRNRDEPGSEAGNLRAEAAGPVHCRLGGRRAGWRQDRFRRLEEAALAV